MAIVITVIIAIMIFNLMFASFFMGTENVFNFKKPLDILMLSIFATLVITLTILFDDEDESE